MSESWMLGRSSLGLRIIMKQQLLMGLGFTVQGWTMFFFQGLAPPWFGSPGPLVPWLLGFSGFLASRLGWFLGFSASVASWLLASWLRLLLGFSASVALGFLASRLRWLLGFPGLKQLHFQDGYMSLSPNSTCAEDLN